MRILQCQSVQAQEAYRKTEDRYEAWLDNTTSQSMKEAALEMVDAYRNQRPVRLSILWPGEIRHATRCQYNLGPRAFVEGCLHRQWEEIQSRYLQSIHSRRSPRRWTAQLIYKTWMVSWDMWDARNGVVHGNTNTRGEQLIAALDAEIRDIYNFGRNHNFLTLAARQFFSKNISEILQMSEHQKRVWRRLGDKHLDNDRKRMQRNREAARMREWLVPGSSRGRRRIRNRTYNHGPLEPGAPGGEGTREPQNTRHNRT